MKEVEANKDESTAIICRFQVLKVIPTMFYLRCYDEVRTFKA